ncbi:MAG: sigma 54-interacting transcriptional regulator [Gemmatimonadetes bacterium]|jgi:DNA-binding NtrC family response regulator/ligand-binding sensor domain-containing protein|nr:sigma 54-interacting transcriptional regulator [Gemmatimonadota bacterium]MBT5327749.1 sigma 54-interacting transcriptional regulator [Gemmatimonadota bacterium]MBT5802073.1 sigma 54-interacting transcriptional regulator [Gemmatimonadota bacterium]MBT6622483.1 sigma 54-interacting transcriptional regulator [Gemmatimonadota bacterium]MBT6903560.1 sigma 54-interacting transcriptional regulator [Gemmatimonadota bacterium]
MNLESQVQTTAEGVGVWEHFSMRDGLPDMKIECIYEDRKGLLWVGTHDRGVVIYDGDIFESYTRKDGLAGDGVFSIIEDDEGCIWLGTSMGLSRYVDGRFETIDIGAPERFLWGSCKDNNGHLWFGVEGSPGISPKVYRWDGGQLDEIYLSDAQADIGISINDIKVDTAGQVWLGGYGLYCFNSQGITQIVEFDEKSSITSILPREDGTIWFTTGQELFLVDQNKVVNNVEVGQEVPRDIVSLAADSLGTIWLGSRIGILYCFDGEIFRMVSSVNAIIWLGLCCDSIGRVWVGTYGMGLYYYDATRVKIYQTNQGLLSNQITSIAQYGTGPIYAASSAGLVRYDKKSIEAISLPDELNVEGVTGLCASSNEKIWLGSRNGSFWEYDGQDFVRVISGAGLGASEISTVKEDLDGSIWFASKLGAGFGCYSESETKVFSSDKVRDYPTWIGALEIARDGKVWMGSASPATWDGLCVYDGKDFTRFAAIEGAAVLALFTGEDESLWVGTNEGVAIYDGSKVSYINQKDGLACDLVTSFCQRTDGIIYIGTEGGGICSCDGQVIQTLQISGQLGANVIYDVLVDQDGTLWAGTGNGLVQYTPRRVRPFVEVAKVIAGNEYEAHSEVSFSSTIGRVSFLLKGRSPLERASYLVYRYCLDGYEEGWRQTRDRQVDYPQLEPGEYTFKVQSVDRDLNYSKIAEVKISVTEDLRIAGLNEALRSASASGDFIGESPTIRQIKRQIKEVAWTDLTVLILGETGTGKGLAVRAIHEGSDRRDRPFLQVNCGSVQRELFDSELFGHERGAFTGAIARKLGKFELADKGTIFLDEIGDLPLESQTRLLHVLQEQAIERVGGTQPINVDVRVIAATNRNLTEAVREGAFREDLYYRLNVIPIEVPPLRERKEDIPLLAKYFVRQFAAHLHQQQPFIHELAVRVLIDYDWPGNVRELEHTLQRAVILAGESSIMPEHIPFGPAQNMPAVRMEGLGGIVPLDEYEKLYLERVLGHTGGVIHGKKGAAYLLGLKPTTLRSRLDRLGVEYRKARV